MRNHSRIRGSKICPLCNGFKGEGLVACWPCYHTHRLRYGDNAEAEAKLDRADDELLAAQTATIH